MIHEFNFHIKKGDFCILLDAVEFTVYSYPKNEKIILPVNSILRVDGLSIKTNSKYERCDVEFYFLVRKNKHIITEYKIPNKITMSIYDLNGVKYSLVKEEDIDAHVKGLMRKLKIKTLLQNEA